MELGVFIGLLLAFIPIVQPMTGWALPRPLARAMFFGAFALIFISLGRSAWPYLGMLSTPWQALLALLNAEQARQILTLGSVLMVALIAATLLLVRPLQSEIVEMRKAMERYVMPRHLSQEQQTKIADFLSSKPPQEVVLVQPNHYEEAGSYRADFHQALTKGGWKIKTVEISEDVGEGLSIHSRGPAIPGGEDGDKPLETLRDALSTAGVTINGTGTGRGVNEKEYRLYLKIGRRRMDDGDLVTKEQIKQQIGELQKQLKRAD